MLSFGTKEALKPAPRTKAYLLLSRDRAVRMESSQFIRHLYDGTKKRFDLFRYSMKKQLFIKHIWQFGNFQSIRQLFFGFHCIVNSHKEHIGFKIKRLRAYRGMTQEGLAKAMGKSRSLVSFLERTGNVNHYTLNEICSILQTSPEELEPDGSSWHEDRPSNYDVMSDKDKLIVQLQEENRFLKETIEKQWNLLSHFKGGKAQN